MPNNQLDSIKKEFIKYLDSLGLSPKSHKNYRSDLSHFLSWAILRIRTFGSFVETLTEVVPFLSHDLVSDYKNYMTENATPAKTVNRRLSTLRHLSKFMLASQIIDFDFMGGVVNASLSSKKVAEIVPSTAPVINEFKSHLEDKKVSPNTIKSYLSDTRQFLSWLEQDLSKVTVETVKAYNDEVTINSPEATAKRKIISLRKFLDWAKTQGKIEANLIEEEKPFTAKSAEKTGGKSKVANWYRKYRTMPGSQYLNIAVIVILVSLLGFGIYTQFIKNSKSSLAYTTSLTRPNRYLSFQGRLTNQYGNPVVAATNVVFSLYSASSGGSPIWTSGTCSISPDTDGVFSTLLGSSCGTELTSDIFSQNASIYLGVTVGADAEALPRVQIATVAYSLNSETLQGFPASASATINTIPVINNSGQMVLAAASPSIQSTSGNFGIQGQAVTLSSTSGSNGNITISPDGTGSANFIFTGASAGGSSNGFMNITDANINGKALIYGAAANNNSGYNLLQLQSGSSLSDKFVVDYAGNASAAGNLTIGPGKSIQTTLFGNMTLGGATTGNIVLSPSNDIAGGSVTPNVTNVTDLGSSSKLFRNIYATTLYQGANQVCDAGGSGCPAGMMSWSQTLGSLYPTNNTVNVFFGATAATATTSAKFAFLGIPTGGTPTASIAGTTAGVNTYLTGNGNLATTNFANLTLGGTTTGNIVLSASNDIAGGSVTPNVTNVTDLGSSTKLFRNVYSTKLYQGANQVCDAGGGVAGCGGVNYWQQTAPIIAPANTTYDLAIGGSATGSAFQVFGAQNAAGDNVKINSTVVATGNVIEATSSAITSGNMIKLGQGGNAGNFTGNGILMDFNNAGGSSFTGNFLKLNNAGITKYYISSNGSASMSGNLTFGNTVGATVQTTNFGNLTLGGTTTGNIILSASNDLAGGNVSPNVTNVTDLGTSSKLFRNIYATTLYQGANQVCDSSMIGCNSNVTLWKLSSNVIAPANTTYDLSIGGSATNSAFQVFGAQTAAGDAVKVNSTVVASGNVIEATSSAITSGNMVKLGQGGNAGNFTGNGILMDFNNAGGSSFTGNFDLYKNAGVAKYTIDSAGDMIAAGYASASGNLTLAGAVARTIQTTGFGNLTIGGSTTGNIVLSASNDIAGGSVTPNVTNVTDLGSSTKLFRNIYSTKLYQGANQVCDAGGNCPTGTNYWQLATTTLAPGNTTFDLTVGGSATGSAFQVFGAQTAAGDLEKLTSNVVATGNVFEATASGITTGNMIKLGQGGNGTNFTGNGLLMDFNNAGGSSFTGNFEQFKTAGTTQYLVDALGNASGAGNLNLGSGKAIQTTLFGNLTIGGSTTGNIVLSASNDIAGGTIAPNVTNVTDLGTSTKLFRNVYSTKLYQGANQVCDAGGGVAGCGGTSYWQLSNLIVSPTNTTYDLAIGGSATGSAFQVFGAQNAAGDNVKINSTVVATGNVFEATSSAITSGNMIKLGQGGNSGNFTGNGILMDFNNAGGSSFTGNFELYKNAGVTKFTIDSLGDITTAGFTSASGNLTLAGAVARSIQTTGFGNLPLGAFY